MCYFNITTDVFIHILHESYISSIFLHQDIRSVSDCDLFSFFRHTYSFTDPSVMPVTKYFCING